MVTVDLGCGGRRDPRASVGIDAYRTPAVTVQGDILRLPFKAQSVDRLTAHQVVEHIPIGGWAGDDPFYTFFDEAWRVLAVGGILEVDVPHANGPDAFADPTHRRFFMERTFAPLWDARLDPQYPRRRWELLQLTTERFKPPPLTSDLPIVARILRLALLSVPSKINVILRKPSA